MVNRSGTPAEFGKTFPRACLALENAIQNLLSGGWEENERRRTHEMAVALTQAAKDAGWWDTQTVLRALDSILALSIREVFPIRQAIREKIAELLGLLKKYRASRSA